MKKALDLEKGAGTLYRRVPSQKSPGA